VCFRISPDCPPLLLPSPPEHIFLSFPPTRIPQFPISPREWVHSLSYVKDFFTFPSPSTTGRNRTLKSLSLHRYAFRSPSTAVGQTLTNFTQQKTTPSSLSSRFTSHPLPSSGLRGSYCNLFSSIFRAPVSFFAPIVLRTPSPFIKCSWTFPCLRITSFSAFFAIYKIPFKFFSLPFFFSPSPTFHPPPYVPHPPWYSTSHYPEQFNRHDYSNRYLTNSEGSSLWPPFVPQKRAVLGRVELSPLGSFPANCRMERKTELEVYMCSLTCSFFLLP